MIIRNGYIPHSTQSAFHNSTAKFKGLITGVGFGKSAAGANELIKTALKYPKALHLILAPTSKIMNFATLAQFWKFCPKEIVKAHVKSQNLIYLKGGARIAYLTADNERHVDRLRGMEIGSFWADEGRLFPRYVWEVLLTRLRDGNGPLTGWLTTTPHGYDWIYYYFVKKQHPYTREPLVKPDNYQFWGGTTLDNPHIPQDYKDDLVAQLHGKFRDQEVYGLFRGFEGQVYDNFVHKTHIVEKLPPPSGIREIIFCVDWGFTAPMAALIIGLDNDKRGYVMKEFYRKRQTIEVLGEWIIKQKKVFDKAGYPSDWQGYCDPSQPLHRNTLNGMGLSVSVGNNKVMPGINFVYDMFGIAGDGMPRLFIHSSCMNLIDEVNIYRYADIKDGLVIKEEPVKVDDHALDALRYGLFTHLATGDFTVLDVGESKFF